MTRVIFLRGLPGSGKSEWASYYAEGRENVHILSFDTILREYDPAAYDEDYTAAFHKNYREANNLLISRVTAHCTGFPYPVGDVIVDTLNLDYQQVCSLAAALLAIDPANSALLVNFFISVEDSIRRQQRRKGHTVSEDRVRQMDVALRKAYTCEFPGTVLNLRFDTSEIITVSDDVGASQVNFSPELSLLI